ncbi:hypothetical protein A5320_02730 [Rheinheimera sp. SA_1]|uniref:DUF4870 family protein n=1 Tax=Rheinheimera sp. SA_1 TaxID=1827365 RepID=UPI0008020FDB|nr:hypothetical protein [Rheinheimera sp. SA_1]OBP16342.1 hypothetical protein A5320_02730 [Rheinheimera sp. SA_1]
MEVIDVDKKKIDAVKEESAKTLTSVLYALYALSFLSGFSGVVAIIINIIKKADVEGTFLASHFRWQIRTFLFSVLWFLLGMACFLMAAGVKGLPLFVAGVLLVVANTVWFIYRVAKGWLYLKDNRPMYRRQDRHGLHRDNPEQADHHRLRR